LSLKDNIRLPGRQKPRKHALYGTNHGKIGAALTSAYNTH